jgi:hypothetical protein
MTIGMHKSAVLCPVASTFRFEDDVVVVPTCFLRDWLVAVWADAFLFIPELQ